MLSSGFNFLSTFNLAKKLGGRQNIARQGLGFSPFGSILLSGDWGKRTSKAKPLLELGSLRVVSINALRVFKHTDEYALL